MKWMMRHVRHVSLEVSHTDVYGSLLNTELIIRVSVLTVEISGPPKILGQRKEKKILMHRFFIVYFYGYSLVFL